MSHHAGEIATGFALPLAVVDLFVSGIRSLGGLASFILSIVALLRVGIEIYRILHPEAPKPADRR